MTIITKFTDLNVYQKAFNVASEIFELSQTFPKEEAYSLTDQIRRSSRSVGSNIAEAFGSRIYPKSFASKLNISESEAFETQHWLDTAFNCCYIETDTHTKLRSEYDKIIGMLINMRRSSSKWAPR